jgi:iron(III) transport system ATP-binding protein
MMLHWPSLQVRPKALDSYKMANITITNLTVGYGESPVISDMSLTIQDGALFTLLGPSGCGKTTLLRTIAGFIPVRQGRLCFGARDITRLPAHLRDIGMVFQDYALFPDKTVFDNVAYGLRARKIESGVIQKTVGEYLERLGLNALADRVPAALSGGQRQRVALARALAIKPAVLLMDEPLSNLDAKLRVQVRDTISDLQKEIGITTVLVTHDQEEALAMSDCIGLFREGALEQSGTPEEIYSRPRSAYVADFVGAANTLEAILIAPVAAGETAHVQLAGTTLAGLAPQALDSGRVTVIARAEMLGMLGDDALAPNQIRCCVRRRQYLGAMTVYLVELESGESLHVKVNGAHLVRTVGERLRLQFDAEETLVVAV